jgi:hypothetical protein
MPQVHRSRCAALDLQGWAQGMSPRIGPGGTRHREWDASRADQWPPGTGRAPGDSGARAGYHPLVELPIPRDTAARRAVAGPAVAIAALPIRCRRMAVNGPVPRAEEA